MQEVKRNTSFYPILLACGVIVAWSQIAFCTTTISQNITQNATWTLSGSPYIVTTSISVSGNGNNPMLTIEPGVTVRFNQDVRLFIGHNENSYYRGRLMADGTPENPIIFTSNQGTPTSGFWRNIYFARHSSGSILNNVVVEYGGSSEGANILCYYSSPAITNSIIRNSSGYGIRLEGDASPQITNCTFSNNGSYPVRVGANDIRNLTGNTFTTNGLNAIEVLGETIDTTGTYTNQGVPYVITGHIYVQGNNNNPVLTIEPGVTVRFNQDVRLYIGHNDYTQYRGQLRADGTPENPIIFTSNQGTPTSGFWRNIYFTRYSSGSILDNVVVEYGGSSEGANIYCYYTSPSITDSTIQKSSNYGIYLSNSSPSIQGCIIVNNKTGVYCYSNFNSSINHCDIVGNSSYGVYNASNNIVNAENNWWGDSSGPGGVGTGTGDAVSNYVDYIPWLSNPYNDITPPAAVTDLSVSGIGDNWVTLAWTVSQGTYWYDIRYATWSITADNWGSATSVIFSVSKPAGETATFTVTGLKQNITYYFRMKTADVVRNWSGPSNMISATTFLPAPSNLTAGIVWEDEIKLSWQDNSNLEDGFSIERKVGNNQYTEIGTVSANITTYHDTNIATNTLYSYRVRAYNELGYSDYSNEATTTTVTWLYQTEVYINNFTNPATLTNYPVILTLTPAIFDYSRVKSDGSDIRFRDNSTLLPYWIERWDTNATSTIWIKIPEILGSSTKIIMMYYGMLSASRMSDGEETFEFFDDFFTTDTNKFSYGESYDGYSALSYNITNPDLLEVYSDGSNWRILNMKRTYQPDDTFAIVTRFKTAGASFWHNHYLVEANNINRNRFGWQDNGSLGWRIQMNQDATGWTYSGVLANLTVDTFYKAELIKKAPDTIEGKIYTDSRYLLANYAKTSPAWSDETWTWVTWKLYTTKSYYDWIFVRKYSEPEPVVTLGSILTGITPNTGVNSNDVPATITAAGAGFQTGAIAKLTRLGQSDIIGTNTVVVTNQTLTTTFDITNKLIGYWDVVVTNPGQLPLILRNGFYIRDIITPIPEIIQPADGAIISGSSVEFKAHQTNGQDGIMVVYDIFVEGIWKPIGTSTNILNNFPVSWNSHQAADGSYTVCARMFDVGDNVGTDTIVVIVDNTAPLLQIHQPLDGAAVSGSVGFKARQTNGSDAILTTYERWTGSTWQMIGTSSDSVNDFPINWNSEVVLDGSYSVRAIMKDHVGNTAISTAITIFVDNTAPIPGIIAPSLYVSCYEVRFKARQTNGNDAVIVTWEIFANNNWLMMGSSTDRTSDFVIIWNSHAVSEGTYMVRAIMQDRADRSGTDSIIVEVDNTSPVSSITSPTAGALLNYLTQIIGTAADTPSSGISKVEINIKRNMDNKYWQAGQWYTEEKWPVVNGKESWWYNWTPNADGSYTLRSRATDGAGNLETPKPGIIFTYDTTPPAVNITYPAAGDILNTHTLDVKITTEVGLIVRTTDPQTGQQISQQADSQGSVTFSGLVFNEGANTIAARATDTAGNTGQGSVNFVVDTTPPYTCCHSPAKDAIDVSRGTNIILHVKDDGTGINQASMVMTVDGGTVTPNISGNKYDYTLNYNPAVDFSFGQVVIVEIYAQDLNTVPRSIQEAYTFTTGIDNYPPNSTITPLFPDPTMDTTPSFTGSAVDILSNVIKIEYRVDGGMWQDVDTFTPAHIVNYSFTITPPLLQGNRLVEVRAMDDQGNTETTYAAEPFVLDTTLPAAPTGANILFYPLEYGTQTAMHLIWNANTEPDIAGYNIYRSSSEMKKMNTGLITNTVYHDTGLEVDKEYIYQVTAVDWAGNESNKSNEIKFVPTCLYGQSLEIYCESFIRGATGKVKVKFINYGLATLNVYTSRNNSPVDDLMIYVKTLDGRILGEGKIYQYDSQTIKYPDYSYAQVQPQSSFMFAPITIHLPGDTPDNVIVEAVIQKSHYDLRPSMNGPILKAMVMYPVSEPDYLITADTDKDVYDQGEVVTISGVATDSEDGRTPVSGALVKIGIKTKGIARYSKVYADTNGSYTYKFTPISGEAGKYTVWAVHSDVLAEECDATFIILGLAIKPKNTGLIMSKNAVEYIDITLHNTGETPLTNVGLNIIDTAQGDGITAKGTPSSMNLEPGKEGKVRIEVSAGINAASSAMFDLIVTANEGAIRYGSLAVQLKEALPIGQLNPYQITKGMKSGDEVIESISVINAGYNILTEVIVGTPTLPWISIITDTSLGDIAPLGSKTFNIKIHPPDTLSTGQYLDKIDITSSNHETLSVDINILITTSRVGRVLFNIRDIFGKPVGTAAISAASQELKMVTFSGKTDVDGKANIENVSAGKYTYWLSASGFNNTGGNLTVEPGIDNIVEATMTTVLMGIEWTVTPTTIEDEYEIKIKSTFETKVPAPRIVITPPVLSFVIQPGKSADAELTIHNFGLISVFNFEILPNSKPPIIIEALTPLIPEIKGNSTVTVPIKVTVLTHASPWTPMCRPYEEVISYDAEDYICYNEDGTVKSRHQMGIASTPVRVKTSHADLGLSDYVFHRRRYINCPGREDHTPNIKLVVCNKDTENVNFCDCGRLRIQMFGIVPFLKSVIEAIDSLPNILTDPVAVQMALQAGVDVVSITNDLVAVSNGIKNTLLRAVEASGECPDLTGLDSQIETLKETVLRFGQEMANFVMQKYTSAIIGAGNEIAIFQDQTIPPGQCTYVEISGNTSQFFGAGGASFAVRRGNGECCSYNISITDSTWICSETVDRIIETIYNWIRGSGRGTRLVGFEGDCWWWWCGGLYTGNAGCPGGMKRVPVK